MNLIKSKKRVRQFGEVFTPPELVEEMLDALPAECWEEDKTFLEPSCGTGNFLVAVLQRKLDAGHNTLQACSTIFGIDIQEDNVLESRRRMLELAPDCKAVIEHNIVVGDALKGLPWE